MHSRRNWPVKLLLKLNGLLLILVDALFVNGGGGKILLDYLTEELEKTDREIFYLLDKTIENQAPLISQRNTVLFLEAGFLKRAQFYRKNRHQFSSVLCFGNLPPNIRLSAKTYTYFHQKLFLTLPTDMGRLAQLKYWLKTEILYSIRKNADFWMVQNESMKKALAHKYRIPAHQVLIRPFYKTFGFEGSSEKTKNTFLYVSTANPHKNHVLLIEQFCAFYEQHQIGQLILTVSDVYPEVVALINRKVSQNYPIVNLGFIQRGALKKVYAEAEFVIYPSLAESFGLGLVEGIEAGCKVIGADLEYLHEVCIPSLTFNPDEKNAIAESLAYALHHELPPSYSKVTNTIQQIIEEIT
ncbi:glycosyltransferase [Chryseobacterium sp. MDT2-18]|uniref:glycosyltransferase n=1 Tax=Chryseobacterium sp. MDT2-18 TaxID=1259136 RepID=UPI00277E42B7|nr:glycosyltransferase [Chryseobacterium sp. MDT2-18]MDQ0476843.1 glycosyltransferase involved in cell wall biosynthesis [Chryseobacterium sp. MDT2-18]